MVKLLNEYPIACGISMIIMGVIWLVLQINKKQSFKMEDHGLGSWREMVGTWGVIVFLILWGIILIVRETI